MKIGDIFIEIKILRGRPVKKFKKFFSRRINLLASLTGAMEWRREMEIDFSSLPMQ
jgi:hypothetical protein